MKTDLDEYSFINSHYCPAFGSIGKVAVKKYFSIRSHLVYKVLFSLSSAIFFLYNNKGYKMRMLNNVMAELYRKNTCNRGKHQLDFLIV